MSDMITKKAIMHEKIKYKKIVAQELLLDLKNTYFNKVLDSKHNHIKKLKI